ncbi:MAG: hypothetical protein AAGJ31_12385 [Verrucomicrobiota bacterium]
MDNLKKKDSHGNLYLAAYQGEFAVISLPGELRKKGQLTPPLELEAVGKEKATVTRQEIRLVSSGKKVTEDTAPTFFGISILDEDQEVVEVQSEEILNKFKATISTKALTAPQKMDKDLFLSSLKNGEVYEVVREEQRRCQNCNGFGRVPWDGTGPKSADGKMPCPDSKGTGKIDWKVTYKVFW